MKSNVHFLKPAVLEVHLKTDTFLRSSKDFACSELSRKKSWNGWWTISSSHSRMTARLGAPNLLPEKILTAIL
jgi:hypothetical protein